MFNLHQHIAGAVRLKRNGANEVTAVPEVNVVNTERQRNIESALIDLKPESVRLDTFNDTGQVKQSLFFWIGHCSSWSYLKVMQSGMQ